MLSLTMRDVDHQRYARPAVVALVLFGFLITIASQAGRSVARLLELDPSLDPRTLRPRQKLARAR